MQLPPRARPGAAHHLAEGGLLARTVGAGGLAHAKKGAARHLTEGGQLAHTVGRVAWCTMVSISSTLCRPTGTSVCTSV